MIKKRNCKKIRRCKEGDEEMEIPSKVLLDDLEF